VLGGILQPYHCSNGNILVLIFPPTFPTFSLAWCDHASLRETREGFLPVLRMKQADNVLVFHGMGL